MSKASDDYALNLRQWTDIGCHLPRLHEAARGDVLELGTRFGVSTSALLAGVEMRGGHLWSIDLNPDCAGLYQGDTHWTFIKGDSRQDHPEIPLALDVLFIDTDHTEETTYTELSLWGPRVKPGGVILMHDTDYGPTYPGVRNAIARWCAETGHTPTFYDDSYGLGEIKC